MKKTFPRKLLSKMSLDGANSHISLASTLKAIVSGELKLDKNHPDQIKTSILQTSILRKQSNLTKTSKVSLSDSNSSSPDHNDESPKPKRKIVNDLFLKDRLAPSWNKNFRRQDFQQTMIDSIEMLKKQVAEIRGQMNHTTHIDLQNQYYHPKPMCSSSSISDTWTELCLAGSASEIRSPQKKSSLQKRLQILEDSAVEDKERLSREISARFVDVELQYKTVLKELTQKLFRVESQQSNIRSDIETLKAFFPLTKSHLIDRLDREMCSIATRLEHLQTEPRPEAKKQLAPTYHIPSVQQNTYCRRESLDSRKQIGEVRAQLNIFTKMMSTISEQVEGFSNIESELKELLAKQEARLGINALASKIVDIEEYVSYHVECLEIIEGRITNLNIQAQQTLQKVGQVEEKLQRQSKPKESEVTGKQLRNTIQTLQNQQDDKLIKVVTEYNQNFLMIDQNICDMRDFIQQSFLLNKTVAQKLQSVWKIQVSSREQLQEYFKSSGDVYTLLENNIHTICELSKKEMSFEHEVKEMKEKLEVVDAIKNRCKRTVSFGNSYSDVKSKKISEDNKEGISPGDTETDRLRSFAGRQKPTSLMDEFISDQSGSFD